MVDRATIPEVVLVVNGSVAMTHGKVVGQAFQAAARWQSAMRNSYPDPSLLWLCEGTRTIVKVALTEAIFERICDEVPGYIMRDEGFTEVAAETPTLFVSRPARHEHRHPLLNNKKVKML